MKTSTLLFSAKAFPNREFNYGADEIISENEYKRRVKGMKIRWENVQMPDIEDITPPGSAPSRYKKLREADEVVVGDTKDSKEWIRRLINEHPPSPEFALFDILQKATKIQPMRTNSDTKLWIDTMIKLKLVIEEGHDLNWADNATTSYHLPALESCEMLRIYGDAQSGFGTWPTLLKERLYQVGAGWVCIPAKDRVIPLYWKHYCDTNKIQYKEAIPGHEPSKRTPRSSRTKEVTPVMASSSRSPVGVDSQTSSPPLDLTIDHLLQRKDEVDFELKALSDPWQQKRVGFKGFLAKDNAVNTLDKLKENVVLLVKTVDKKFKHDKIMLKHLCEATKLDTLLDNSFASMVETAMAEIQGRSVTKKDLQGLVKSEDMGKHVNAVLGDHHDDGQTLFGGMHEVVCTLKDTVQQQNTTIDDLNGKLKLQETKLGELEDIQAQMKAALEGLKPKSQDSQGPIIGQMNTSSRPHGSGQRLNAASSSHNASTSFRGKSQDLLGPFSKVSAAALPDNSVQGSGTLKHNLSTSEPPAKKRRRLVSRRQYLGNDSSGSAPKDDSSRLSVDGKKSSGGKHGRLGITRKGLDCGPKAGVGSVSKSTFTAPSVTSDVSHAAEEPEETSLFLCEKSYERLLSEDEGKEATIGESEPELPLLSDDDDSEIHA